MLNKLCSQLHKTQGSLATHVGMVRALEDMLAEHGGIKAEVVSLVRELMDERKHEPEISRHAAGPPSDAHHHNNIGTAVIKRTIRCHQHPHHLPAWLGKSRGGRRRPAGPRG